MTIFADPIMIALVLAVFSACTATGTSIVIGVHFEKLRRQTENLNNAIDLSQLDRARQAMVHAQMPDQDVEMAHTQMQIDPVIAANEIGAAARLLNGHDPAKHVRFV